MGRPASLSAEGACGPVHASEGGPGRRAPRRQRPMYERQRDLIVAITPSSYVCPILSTSMAILSGIFCLTYHVLLVGDDGHGGTDADDLRDDGDGNDAAPPMLIACMYVLCSTK